MTQTPKELIEQWLQRRLSPTQWEWLQHSLIAIEQSNSDKALYIALGMAPRKLGKHDLNLNDKELAQANAASQGWHPSDWSIDGAARILTLLNLAKTKPDEFELTLQSLFAHADVSEAVIYYRALGLFPYSSSFDNLIGQGLRTNMKAVFEAIAHNNPYPAKHFDDHRWNHMILKALFIDSALFPILDLDERANPELAQILCNYAQERWSANRSVTAELWRCVGPYATNTMLTDLARACQSDNRLEHCGAMLALSQCPLTEADVYLATYPETAQAIANAEITWDTLTTDIATEQQRIH